MAQVAAQHLLDSVRLSLTQAVLSTPPPLKQADSESALLGLYVSNKNLSRASPFKT